jgi:hypothetical protein
MQEAHLAADPDLGADMAEIRARVLGRRGTAANQHLFSRFEGTAERLALSAEEQISSAGSSGSADRVNEEPNRRYQIDLNDEAHAAALEDPTLLAHMEAARHRLAEQERALLRLPALEALRTSYLKSVGALSALVRDLGDRHEAERELVEISLRQGRALAGLIGGRKVHGFPLLGAAAREDPGVRQAMEVASEKATASAGAYEALLAFVESSRKTLFILRRDVEGFGQGLIDLVEASEDDRRGLKEYLALASRAARIARAPPPGETPRETGGAAKQQS